MSEVALTEWLNSPETKMLVVALRHRRAGTLRQFLAGEPVDLIQQGRAAALFELEALLTQCTPDDVTKVFEAALKEQRQL